MAKPYEVLRFEGDFHLFRINDDETETAVLDRPIEASGVVTQFEEGETRTVISKGRDRYNTPIYSEQDPGVPSLQMTLLEFPDDIKALLFAGDLTVTEEAGAAVTNEVVVAPGAGNIVKLAHGMIASSGITVTNAGATVTYVSGTDYTIDRTFGVLKVLEGSAITENQSIRANYTYTAVKVTKIAGGVKPQQRFRVVGYLKNRPTSRDAFLEVFDVKLGRSGDTDVLGEEPLTIELSGVMTTPPGKTSPFEYIERVDNA
jgi:hypothetical protein